MLLQRTRPISLLANHFRSIHLKEVTDRFGGVLIDLTEHRSEEIQAKDFDVVISDRLKSLTDAGNVPALWLRVPLILGHLLPIAAKKGLKFHHAENETATLFRWLMDEPSRIPRFATHQVGVAGVVVNERQELLMVKEKSKRYSNWKFPTGVANLNETFGAAAVREVAEETGVQTKFRSVLAFRHQLRHPTAFGRSDILVVCRLDPLTHAITPCDYEITDCRWYPLKELRDSDLPHLPRQILRSVRFGLVHGWENFELTERQYPAVYSGLLFDMYFKEFETQEVAS